MIRTYKSYESDIMILVFGGIKGGTGKSTLATNIAVCAAIDGKKVLLIDADEQRSASDWANQRESSPKSHSLTTISMIGNRIHTQINKMKSDYDIIIVDAGGRDNVSQRSALTVADIFIIPFKPRSFDIWTFNPLKSLIDEISTVNDKLKSYYVINQGDYVGSDNETAYEILCESGLNTFEGTNVIVQRKAFVNAAADGLGVLELTPKDLKACNEIKKLYESIYGH